MYEKEKKMLNFTLDDVGITLIMTCMFLSIIFLALP